MSHDEIMQAERVSEAAKVELEARVEALEKKLSEETKKGARLSEQLHEADLKREQAELGEKRYKEEFSRMMSKLQSRGKVSGEQGAENSEEGKESMMALRFELEQLTRELQAKESTFQSALSEAENKISSLKAHVSELGERNDSLVQENDRLRKATSRFEETIELINTEAATWREKLLVLENEKRNAIERALEAQHMVELKENEKLKLESKYSTELAKVYEEIERAFEEAEKAVSERKSMQEELETLQTSTSYLNNQLEEKMQEISDYQAKISSQEQLLLKFEGVSETETDNTSETVRQLNQKLEEQMAQNQRLNHEVLQSRQHLIIVENSACQLRQTIQDLTTEAQRLKQKLSETESEISNKEREIEDLASELKQESESLSQLREEFNKLSAKGAVHQNETDNVHHSKKIQMLEMVNSNRINEIIQLNEQLRIAKVQKSTMEQEYQALKQSTSRECHEMQSKIRSLQQQNNLLIDIKKEKEMEISKLRSEAEKEITILRDEIDDKRMMCETYEKVDSTDNPAKAEMKEMMAHLRRQLEEKKDAKGDPIAMAQEIKQLRAELNKRTLHNKKLLDMSNQQMNQLNNEMARLKRLQTESSKHLGVSQETLKAKQVEINRQKEEIRLLTEEKMGYAEEIRGFKNQIQMAINQNNWPNESHNYYIKEIETLRQCLAEKERRINDLVSDNSNAKDRMIVQYRQSLEDAQKKISKLERDLIAKERAVHALREQLVELSKQFNIPVDHSAFAISNDRDFIYKCLCEVVNSMSLLKEFSSDEPYIERSHEEIKNLVVRLTSAIKSISVDLTYPRKERLPFRREKPASM